MAFRLGQIAKDAGGTPLMANSVAAGAVYQLLGLDLESLRAALRKKFAKKDEGVAKVNIACAEKGAELTKSVAFCGRLPSNTEPGTLNPEPHVVSGSESIGLAAAVSGVKVACSYPMTPSTGVFTFLAGAADKYGIVVEQAEDEIAAVNLICGASYAGVPAMTTTSGGGFALMVEGLSLAGMLELPILILLSQRPAPATGLPTRTGQEDLSFVVHAGHGEFPRAVFAPGTVPQGYELAHKALETAHRWQIPVLLLSDQFLVDQQKNIPALSAELRPIDRCIVEKPKADYRRYEVTRSGVSPRAIPGSGPFVVVDSDEHTEDGHLTEDLAVRVRMQDKRMRKGRGLAAEALAPEVYPGPEPAAEVLLCWGSTYGPCREAVDVLRAAGRDVCMIHFGQVWPVNRKAVRPLFRGRKVTAVEGNGTAQFAGLLKTAGALGAYKSILRYDGLPFTGEEIARRMHP
jgi:2-oxoglutarate ferredoxin oxidoreductase subunit alpha